MCFGQCLKKDDKHNKTNTNDTYLLRVFYVPGHHDCHGYPKRRFDTRFADEQTETKRNNLPRTLQLVNSYTKSLLLQSLCSFI